MNRLITGGLVIALVLGFWGAVRPAQKVNTVHETRVEQVGSVTGPSVDGPYFDVNGVSSYFNRRALTLATNTPCALLAPTTGTSTLKRVIVDVKVSSSTATTWDFANGGTSFNSTSTAIYTGLSLGSGVKGTLVWNATSTALDPTYQFIPGQYLVVGVRGVNPAGTGLGGACQAEWIVN